MDRKNKGNKMTFCTTCKKSIPDNKLYFWSKVTNSTQTKVPVYVDASHVEHFFCSKPCREKYMGNLRQTSLMERIK